MKLISYSVNETLDIGKKIAKNLKKGDIICLFGGFGSGKTILTKGIARGLGIKKNIVISPSFVIMRQYLGKGLTLSHFDLYRLKKRDEIFALGLQDYLYADGVAAVEWADRLGRFIPREYLKINLEIAGKTKRKIEISAFGQRYQALIRGLKTKRCRR